MLYVVSRPIVLIQIIGDAGGMITMPYRIVTVSFLNIINIHIHLNQ